MKIEIIGTWSTGNLWSKFDRYLIIIHLLYVSNVYVQLMLHEIF